RVRHGSSILRCSTPRPFAPLRRPWKDGRCAQEVASPIPRLSRFRAFDERMHNVTAPRGARSPWYASNGRRGGGTSAAKRSSNSSGSNRSAVEPSLHRRLDLQSVVEGQSVE